MIRRHNGVTVIQMLVVISVTSIILGFGGVILHGTLRSHNEISQRIEALQALQRLERRWRDDIHSAKSASEQDNTLTIASADEVVITYVASESRIHRTVQRKDQPLQNEFWILDKRTSVRFVVQPDSETPIVSVILSSVDSPALDIRIESMLGSAARMFQTTSGSEF